MSPIPTDPAARLQQHHHRHSVISRASFVSLSDDEDAITPVTATEGPSAHPPVAATAFTPAESFDLRRSSMTSDKLEACRDQQGLFDPAEGEQLDTAHVWKRMLALQRMFGCYNSARMSAALEDEAVEAVVRE